MIIIVTTPLGVTRATMLSPMPVLTFETPVVTDPRALAVELDWVGTVEPTLIDAGMLSVAITDGAERTLALLCASRSVTVPRSSRLLPTNIAADSPLAPGTPPNPFARPASRLAEVGAELLPLVVNAPETEVPVELVRSME